ncbi:hypothetical protein KGF57_003554 [Candida theae]|uniref:PWWP domain-containing protein n=1 Tax=Candida theae TaxID=1198502 RepID=A0AAD5BE20_9ASCO|nr:uncharacterized protein KGF57_003554 [Candida theae]KAI5956068.1 hypothetical protein KGF57_003554 [Candida theae]
MSEQYPPKSIVLAKVKGYPAWPAMVLDVSLLPSHILNKRPMNKQHEPTPNIIPIKFFSDDTYIWIKSTDIKPLSQEDIAAHFFQSSKKRRKDTVLDQAFQLAKDPLDMKEFIKYGSKGAPEGVDANAGDDVVDTGEEEEEEEEEEDVVVKVPPRKKQKVVAPASAVDKKSLAEAKKREEEELLAQYDSDWGVQDFNKYSIKEGNYIYDSLEEQKTVFAKVPEASEFSQLYEKAIAKFRQIEEDVLEQLLTEKPNIDELCHLLTQFSSLISKVPRSVISKSKLLRALIVDQRKQVSEDDDGQGQLQFKERASKILKRLGIEVRENIEEDFEAKSEAVSAQSTPTSTVQSTPEVVEPVDPVKEEVVVKVDGVTVNPVDSPLKHEVQINGN